MMTATTTKQSDDLTIRELISRLSTDSRSEKLILDNLGILFLDTALSSRNIKIVESSLIKLLLSHNKSIRRTAYYLLKCTDKKISNYACASIDIFKRQPTNKHIVEEVAMCHWLS